MKTGLLFALCILTAAVCISEKIPCLNASAPMLELVAQEETGRDGNVYVWKAAEDYDSIALQLLYSYDGHAKSGEYIVGALEIFNWNLKQWDRLRDLSAKTYRLSFHNLKGNDYISRDGFLNIRIISAHRDDVVLNTEKSFVFGKRETSSAE